MIENVSPKKFLGQHFLIDENISKKIVNSVSLKEFDKIIEIGPGKVLTGMVKRTLTNVKSFSINSIADIKNLKNEFKK